MDILKYVFQVLLIDLPPVQCSVDKWSSAMLNMVTVTMRLLLVWMCCNSTVLSSRVLQRLPLRHHRVHELIHAGSSIFCTRNIFLFNAAVQFFFHSLSVNKGEMEGYVELTAEEIAVKRSLHFSFSPSVFFLCYWPLVGIWIFKRHFIRQSFLLLTGQRW